MLQQDVLRFDCNIKNVSLLSLERDLVLIFFKTCVNTVKHVICVNFLDVILTEE